MIGKKLFILCIFLILYKLPLHAQQKEITDSIQKSKVDSSQQIAEKYIFLQKEQENIDSIVAGRLKKELSQLSNDSKRKRSLEDSLHKLLQNDSVRKQEQLQKINDLKLHATGYPVRLITDTLFYIYTRIGSFSAEERAHAIEEKIKKLYEDDFFNPDSLAVVPNETTYDIIYNNDIIVMSVTDLDALWYNESSKRLADVYLKKIKAIVINEKEDNSLINLVKRIVYVIIIFAGIWLIVFGINRLFKYTARVLGKNKEKYFSELKVKKIEVLSAEQHYRFAMQVNNIIRIVIILLSLYLALLLLFAVFPQTKPFVHVLLNWIITPAKTLFNSVLSFLPNLFTILVIFFITRYLVKLFRYIASGISNGTINITGFYREWALPTFNVARFLIYAFMLVIIFPYIPGSQSPAFRGITVFIGVLVSLGSSSAISNIVAGLVITYMRPFKLGDRVKIGEVVGDVTEKTMLVTRIRTIKNEDITVPNSTVLNSYTINYSANAQDTGLIVHTTVTIGYNVPWKDMHQALIDAALRTEFILQDPVPFVLQTSLDDFFVSYQVNAYTKEANKQATIYSDLHKNIQDVCNERGIEIMSPHYNAIRDGNTTTNPASYVPADYRKPSFNVNLDTDKLK